MTVRGVKGAILRLWVNRAARVTGWLLLLHLSFTESAQALTVHSITLEPPHFDSGECYGSKIGVSINFNANNENFNIRTFDAVGTRIGATGVSVRNGTITEHFETIISDRRETNPVRKTPFTVRVLDPVTETTIAELTYEPAEIGILSCPPDDGSDSEANSERRTKDFSQLTRAYLATRANLLLSSDADSTRINRRVAAANGAGFAQMSLAQDRTRKQSAMTLGPSGYSASTPLSKNPNGLRVWSEGYLSWFDENRARDGDFQVLYAGGDILLRPNVMLGITGQVDWMDESSGRLGSKIDGQGWMVGPYFGILLGPVWQFDGRAAWGQSENDMNLLGGKGSFDTDRWLARGSLRGNWYSGPWRLTATTEIGYVEEQQDSFRESGGAFVPGQTVSLGRFTFGPELAYRIEGNGTFVEPQVSLQGLWNFDQEGNILLDGFVSSPDDFYGRIEAGLMFGRTGGLTFRAMGSYEGIGASDFEMWSARFWGSVPLQLNITPSQ